MVGPNSERSDRRRRRLLRAFRDSEKRLKRRLDGIRASDDPHLRLWVEKLNPVEMHGEILKRLERHRSLLGRALLHPGSSFWKGKDELVFVLHLIERMSANVAYRVDEPLQPGEVLAPDESAPSR